MRTLEGVVSILLFIAERLQGRLQKPGEPSVGLLEASWREERLVEGHGPSHGSWPRSVAKAQRWSAMREIQDFFFFKNLNVCPALYLTHISSQRLCTLVTVLRD